MTEDYPKTVLEFERRFATDAACRAYLMALRWPEGFVCPRCGGCKAWPTVHDRWVCAACRHQATVTAGTIFQDTRQPLRLWFRAMWYVTSQKNGASALGLQRVLGLGGYLTAWSWLHKLRRAMVRPGRERLGGEVEVDETYVGGLAEGPRGRGSQKKALVAIAAQKDGKGIGRIRLARIADASTQSLRAFVEASLAPGTQVMTDGWEAYAGLPQWGYGHSVHVLRGQGADAAARLLPRGTLGGCAAETLAVGNAPGSGPRPTPRLLPGRVHFPLQSAKIRVTRQTVLSTGAAGGGGFASALQTTLRR